MLSASDNAIMASDGAANVNNEILQRSFTFSRNLTNGLSGHFPEETEEYFLYSPTHLLEFANELSDLKKTH